MATTTVDNGEKEMDFSRALVQSSSKTEANMKDKRKNLCFMDSVAWHIRMVMCIKARGKKENNKDSEYSSTKSAHFTKERGFATSTMARVKKAQDLFRPNLKEII